MSLASMSTSPRRNPASRTTTRWALATADGCDVAACSAFLDRVDAMSCADWLAIGTRALATDVPAAHDIGALDGAIAARRLGVAAWLVRDTIETAACLACIDVPPDVAIAARRACAAAALALLLRPWLDRASYRALTAPFATLAVD